MVIDDKWWREGDTWYDEIVGDSGFGDTTVNRRAIDGSNLDNTN